MLFAQWYFSDTMALRSMRAQIVTPSRRHSCTDWLTGCAPGGHAQAAGRHRRHRRPQRVRHGRSPDRAVVCVTTGLLRRLDRDELEGVLSHELAHVAHRDVTVMTIASFARSWPGS